MYPPWLLDPYSYAACFFKYAYAVVQYVYSVSLSHKTELIVITFIIHVLNINKCEMIINIEKIPRDRLYKTSVSWDYIIWLLMRSSWNK